MTTASRRRRLQPEIEFAYEFVVVERLRRAAFIGDLAMHNDIAAIGDADCLVEILFGHQHRQIVALLNSPILSIIRLTRTGASPTDGSSISRILGADISARANASICCSPPLMLPASWRRRSRSTAKVA